MTSGGEDQAKLLELLQFDHLTAVAALDANVARTPGKAAIRYGDARIEVTYGEFSRVTDRIAGNLVALGVAPGRRVSVLSRNPLTAAAVMYGSWKAGGVYAPLNFQLTGDLLAHQIKGALPAVVIVDDTLLAELDQVKDVLPPGSAVVVSSGESPLHVGGLSAPAPRPGHLVGALDPANVIHTSGTTGPAKGVLQSHRWINGFTWTARRMLDADDVVYSDLPMYHVGGAHFNLVRALWVGATVCLWDRFSPRAYWQRIAEGGCTTAVLLDVMVPWLLEAPPVATDRVNSLNKVHMQPLSSTYREFAERFGIDTVTAGFGQSESGASLGALVWQAPPGRGTPAELYAGRDPGGVAAAFELGGMVLAPGEEAPRGLMGRPNPITEVAVMDDDDVPCNPGVVGQLVMRPRLPGVLFDEYVSRPDATREAMRNGWFHTGDAAVMDADGVFCYASRLGDRIRVRGENISGFDVEEMLQKHPSVQLAAVVAAPSADGEEDDIVAFVQASDEPGAQPPDAESLRAYCVEVMPKYMRPGTFVFLDELPRTPTNKIKKYELRERARRGVHR